MRSEMGEAKRKKLLQAQSQQHLQDLQVDKLAQAVRQVVAAVTDFHGADCLLFSAIGAGVLQRMGVEARPVAGSVAWRVGPGDSDTISHARELKGPLYMQGAAEKALQFHAWIEAPGLLADFSTSTLKLKARLLDEADGGKTQVDWAPDYLWLTGESPAERLRSPVDVNKSYDTGVYSYVRHMDIERIVLPDVATLMSDLSSAIAAAGTVYHALCAGHQLTVAGLGGDKLVQTEAQTKPLQAVRPGDLAKLEPKPQG
jgi:hypothetical protein